MLELKHLRKLNEKHFLKEDGTIEARIYPDNVHYLKDNKYIEINNTLKLENNRYVNKDNDLKVSFAKDSNEELLEVKKSKHYLKFRINNCNKVNNKPLKKDQKIRKRGEIRYNNIFDNIDVIYDILPSKIKESIIIKDKASIKDEFIFNINTDLGLKLVDGKVRCGEFIIEKPYMKDSDNKINHNLYYELNKKEEGYELVLKLDKDWLLSDIKYPVYIDPTITTDELKGIEDTYIYNRMANYNYGLDYLLKANVTSYGGIYRTLIKFALPKIGTGDSIIDARLYLYDPNIYAPTLRKIRMATIHRLTSNWTETTATWDNMNDKYDSRIEDYLGNDEDIVTVGYGENYRSFNITNLVKRWYSGTPNYGVLIKTHEEVYYQNEVKPEYVAHDNGVGGPLLAITYRNQNGLEPYMTYQTFELSNSSISANNYNGNITVDFLLGSTIGGKLPVDLNLFYNTNDVVLENNYGLIKGFKFSLYQTLKKVTIDEEVMYQYLDEDGTIHYFYEEKDADGNGLGKYKDEDSLDLELILNDNDWTIKDKNNNKLIFTKINDIYYLSKIVDVKNSEVNIIYENNQIVKIKDGNNNEINIDYNDNIVITSPLKTTTLNITDGKIVSIVDNVGTTTINYNDNIISSITDVNLNKIKFEYYDVIPYRVKKISEYGKNDTLGNTYDFSYGFELTNIKDNKDRINTYNFNHFGNTTSITNLKETDNIASAYGKSYIYDQNRLTNNHEMTKYVKNLIWNSSFEMSENDFISDDSLDVSITDECSLSGTKSLKLSGSGEAYASYSVTLAGSYTFSFYSKAFKPYSVWLENGNNISNTIIINPNNEFERYTVTINDVTPTSNIKIFIGVDDLTDEIIYIDDIQLENNKVANSYNLIDNSDFEYDLAGWNYNGKLYEFGETFISDDNSDEILTDSNGNNMFKMACHPKMTKFLSRSIAIDGAKGDIYYLSFWYKNLGLIKEYDDYKNNTIQLGFFPKNEMDAGDTFFYADLNPCSSEWQFYSTVLSAPYDYYSLRIAVTSILSANEFYVTNFTLIKDVGDISYQYDSDGNMIGFKDKNKTISDFNYDQNNQLIKMTDPLGNELHYEYDKEITDRILRGISTSGIANEIVYDDIGNPILTKIQADAKELSNGLYHIKLKGSNQYLKVNPLIKNIMLSEDNCSHDVFNITITDQNLNIKPIFHNNIYISNSLFDNISFEFIKQLDNSYMLKLNDKYVTSTVDGLCLSEEEDKINQCFYFENQDSKLYIENSAEYSLDGRFLTKTIDTLFNETSYVTNDKGLITSMTDPLGNTTNYTYNTKDQLIKIVKGDMEVRYEYNGTLLSKIIQDNKEYIFNYDEFLNTKSIYINNNKLIENNYEENNGNLLSSVYGNNDSISYQYDEFDRLNKLIKMNNTYNYYYDNFGNIKKIASLDNTYNYEYDFAQRLIGYKENNFELKYDYNELDNLVLEKQILNNITNTYSYEHNNEDNITKIVNDDMIINYTYDELQRLKERNINGYITKYNYVTNGNRTSSLIESILENDDIYKYKYDKLGNIIKIIKNDELLSNYEYDQYNQLIKEENGLETITYEYDNFGNILNKKTYNEEQLITTDEYVYANLNWKDQLTKYNDIIITYDEIGNPLTIGDISLSWINGRQLNSYTTSNLNINYKYNKDGIRTEKNVNGNITKYYVEGNKIIYLQKGNEIIYFLYENDVSIGFKYAGNTYYYIKNLQNDVLGILNSEFEQIVEYEYDSYGKIRSIKDGLGNVITDTNHIAYINPFRYRSYYYDDETGLYYLNSRYYNPTWGRFINADGILQLSDYVLHYNLFAYCTNNVILYSDPTGYFKLPSFKDIIDSVKTVLGITKNPATNQVLKSTSNIVKEIAKSELEKAVVFEVSSGYGYGVTTDFGGLKVGAKHITYKSTTTIKPLPKWNEFHSITSESSIKFANVGISKITNLESDEWYFGIDNVDVSKKTIFIGLEAEAYFKVGGGFKVGLEFDESNLFYHGYRAIFK